MSDSEDDFMSDKFLVEAPAPQTKSYTQRREAEKLRSLRKGQANNMPSLAQREKERRAEGLSRSLFDEPLPDAASVGASASGSASAGAPVRTTGGNKAMEMMMKMGWKVGQGLGKERGRSSSPEGPDRRHQGNEDEDRDDQPRGGIGIGIGAKRPRLDLDSGAGAGAGAGSAQSASRGRIEPIRVSLWAGRKGLTARSPSPPPLRTSSGRNPDALAPERMRRLGERTEDFRAYQRKAFAGREGERKARGAREVLLRLDEEGGVKFHPLHVLPFDPLGTLPRPLLALIYPAQIPSFSPAPSPPAGAAPPSPSLPAPDVSGLASGGGGGGGGGKYVSEAERTRERMRRDMLTALDPDPDVDEEGNGSEDDAVMARKRALGLVGDGIGAGGGGQEGVKEGAEVSGKDYEGVVWVEMVSPTKRVLRMDTEAYLAFVLSQLRNEHLFCYWCGTKYASFDEMDGFGGCPGDDEDAH